MTEAEGRLAETTERIMDELDWFASEYQGAIAAFKEAGEEVTSTVNEVAEAVPLTKQDVRRLDGEIDRPRMDQGWPWDIWWEKGDKRWRRFDINWQEPIEDDPEPPLLDSGAIDSLRQKTDAFADTFEEELHPHFSGAGKERQFGASTIDVIEQFNTMGDAAMVVAGLIRLYEHYETVTGSKYVQENLSNDPIRNRLVKYLTASGTGPNPDPPLFELDYRGQYSHTAFVHARTVGEDRAEALAQTEPVMSINGSTSLSGELQLQSLVKPLTVDDDRVDVCYAIVNMWENTVRYSEEFPSQTIFCQRYTNTDAARSATRSLLDRNTVWQSDQIEVQIGGEGGTNWTPIVYSYESEQWYALFKQVGRTTYITGVSRRPFEHRDEDWTDPLELSWIRTGEPVQA
ncbi:hypothetical protein [Halorientalis salina]|uniref:hypothetical protein n=1 Tax=Halorientalis salina TaxID=2932266 RepID=UPI0010ABB639|nr:hypothetical protein [Halorientalis salina]